MEIIARTGNDELAVVYIGQTAGGKLIEFAESVQPPVPRNDKWVLLISTLFGCPVKCRFCDAGAFYQGKLSKEEMLAQIKFLIRSRYPDSPVPAKKFKIQFARMGEPAFNAAVLDVLECLPGELHAPGLFPSVSTVAPHGTDSFFERLLDIKQRLYHGRFQLQFSLHSTDPAKRDWLVPVRKWDFEKIAQYGRKFYAPGDRKITLNFALTEETPLKPEVLLNYFDPDLFIIKITPVNPTFRAQENHLNSHIDPVRNEYKIIDEVKAAGYEVLLSIGETEENNIGSNCGQHIMNYLDEHTYVAGGYTYPLIDFETSKSPACETA